MIPLYKECKLFTNLTKFSIGQMYYRWVLDNFRGVVRIKSQVDEFYVLEIYYGPEDDFHYDPNYEDSYDNMMSYEVWEEVPEELALEIIVQGQLSKDMFDDTSY